jgi:ATP-dependent Clp protease ATP-binding subunit ClpC
MEQAIPLKLNSPRAQKARYASSLSSKPLQLMLVVITLGSVILSLALLLTGNTLGLLVLLPAIPCTLIRWWYAGELSQLQYQVQPGSIDGLLAPEILSRMRKNNPSAFDVWEAANRTEARWFFENRFMLHPSIFDQFLAHQAGSAEAVWRNAEVLRQQYQLASYEAPIVIVALLRSIPDIGQLLRQANLEISDIEAGIAWLLDVQEKRRLAAKKQHFGGMARDWSYGYTPLLSYLGHNVTEEVQRYGFFEDTSVHAELVGQMVQTMGSGSTALTLIGEVGVGKTTCVYAFAEQLIKNPSVPGRVKHRQVVALDAPALLSQAKNPGELEGLVIKLINEAQRAKNIILFFDDAHVFFSEGTGSIDLSNILQPAIESGGVMLMFAMTPKELQQISTSNSALASRLQTLQVQPADEQSTIHVLRDQVLMIEYQQKVLFTQQSLREAYRLGNRYIDAQAMPGAALSVLKTAAPLASDGYVTADTIQRSIESSLGVKLRQTTRDESSVLLSLEDELHKYVINQKQAVSVISDALRRSRSGVGNPERPVGTFLFLGPTGVGKTELSKALARVYFGSEDAIVRVDMNQFVQPEDVNRMITPMLGEQLGFLGQMRRSPFSVVLLDEIEKAHPNVVNLLLQMLDEGVMKDIDNKPVSFKDAIVIATSNAGADEIRRMLEAGEDIVAAQAKLVDYIINQRIFAPEFVNRFDEAVMFRPLTPEELVQVIDLIIAGINKTLDSKKVQVVLTDAAKRWLVDKGYDVRLGARPMRRVAQKYVENILARRLLTQDASSGSTISLDVSDFEALA